MNKKAISCRFLILLAVCGTLTLFMLLPGFHEARSQGRLTRGAVETGAPRSASALEPTVEILEPFPDSLTDQDVIPVSARYGPGVVVVAARVNGGPWQILPQAEGIARGELKLSLGRNLVEFRVLNELWAARTLSVNVTSLKRTEADESVVPTPAVAAVDKTFGVPEVVEVEAIEAVEVREVEVAIQPPEVTGDGEVPPAPIPEEAAIADAPELPGAPVPELAEATALEEIAAAPAPPEPATPQLAEAPVPEPVQPEEAPRPEDTVITETNLQESELAGGDIWAVEVLLDRLDVSDVVPMIVDDIQLSDIEPVVTGSDLSGYIDYETLQ